MFIASADILVNIANKSNFLITKAKIVFIYLRQPLIKELIF